MALTLQETLQPGKPRLAVGKIPDSAIRLVSQYVMIAVGPARAMGVLPQAIVTQVAYKIIEEEWKITAKSAPGTAFDRPWDPALARSVYEALWTRLSALPLQQRIDTGTMSSPVAAEGIPPETLRALLDVIPSTEADIQTLFRRIATADVPQARSPEVVWFFYRVLVNLLYAVMKALVQSGLPVRTAYALIVHPGLGAGKSAQLNQFVVQLAIPDWVEMGFAELFSEDELRASKIAEAKWKAQVAARWEEYRNAQERLQQRIESLEAIERALRAAKTPFDAIHRAASAGLGVLELLAEIPTVVWIAIAGLAGYSLVLRPMLKGD